MFNSTFVPLPSVVNVAVPVSPDLFCSPSFTVTGESANASPQVAKMNVPARSPIFICVSSWLSAGDRVLRYRALVFQRMDHPARRLPEDGKFGYHYDLLRPAALDCIPASCRHEAGRMPGSNREIHTMPRSRYGNPSVTRR